MSTTIARLYESYGNALAASNELKAKGFGDRTLSLISKASNVASHSAEDVAKEIEGAGIPGEGVAPFATAVEEGKSLLVIRAGFGMAIKAMKTARNHSPADGSEYYVPEFTQNTADSSSLSYSSSVSFLVSSWLNIPLLINDPAPLSRILRWPTLSKGFIFGEPKLSQGYTFGEPKLSNNATAFSDALNLPVLLKGPEK